ncbi:biotin/lipoate A/B protein ligase family protein [Rubritalea spongiae]|uniref:Biotin/lipoate A/B protein ligase family protein n=1 Tax=Rubritalea spongiae TaxID=430797 RepID=A0ABW5E9Q1_9BACT
MAESELTYGIGAHRAVGVPLFSDIDVIYDSVARSGEENMAVDQLLLEGLAERPMLRFYQWSEPTVSLGYFEKLSDAQRAFAADGLHYVRRWTGGGIVDHRVDQTYSLLIPKGHVVEQLRGSASYFAIHRALAASLQEVGIACSIVEEDLVGESRACFEKPVAFDILDAGGKKLAGAGQRRTRDGLLHQGSVQGVQEVRQWQQSFRGDLADREHKKDIAAELLDDVCELVAERYGSESWLLKRP